MHSAYTVQVDGATLASSVARNDLLWVI